MGKERSCRASEKSETQPYEGEELLFLSAEFLREKITKTLTTIPEFREACIERASQQQEVGIISVDCDWNHLEVMPSSDGTRYSLQVIRTTPYIRTSILVSSNEETKNGMFEFTKEELYKTDRPARESDINNSKTFYKIIQEVSYLQYLAYSWNE